MRVSIIVAISQNNVIGKNNDLIWKLPKDMKFFKNTTKGHHVIMGRKNHESIPHKYSPLPDRTNIVVSRNPDYKAEGCIIVSSIKEGLNIAKKNNDSEPFIIGGGQIYKIALDENLVDRMYVTVVKEKFEGDTFFPEISSEWKEIERIDCKADKEHAYDYSFLVYEKNI